MIRLRDSIDWLEIELSAVTPDKFAVRMAKESILRELKEITRPFESKIQNDPELFIIDFCKKHNVTYAEMFSKSKKREHVMLRQALHYLFRTKTTLSSSAIGKLVGNKDHATVLHSEKVVNCQPKVFAKYFK